jgi:hypothetical protein
VGRHQPVQGPLPPAFGDLGGLVDPRARRLLEAEHDAGVAHDVVPGQHGARLVGAVGELPVGGLSVGQPPDGSDDRGASFGRAHGRALLRRGHADAGRSQQAHGPERRPRSTHGGRTYAQPVRRVALLLSLALVVLWPALHPSASDGFPLSTYPMFAHDTGSVRAIVTVVGIDVAGAVHRLDPHAIGGGDEVMLAAEAARYAVRDGSATEYCAEVAARVDDDTTVAVEVRTEVRDAVADVDASRPADEVRVHARCEVRR